MSSFRVGGKVVEKVDLCRKKQLVWRLDVWPFAILYTVWLTTIVPSIDFSDACIALGGLSAFHILVLLFTTWSVDFKCFVQFSKVNSIDQADACKVTPAKFSGSKEVVPLHFRSQMTDSASSGDMEEIFFDFRKQRFIYSKELGAFSKLPYPTKETFGHYLKCTGHGTEAKIATATEKWGRNVFDYPQPTFQKLMKENCMEPFFVFQVFCVGLWCLDEFWYYSVFTLFMLFMFESTMAKSRLKTLTDLRSVRVDSQTVMVYRSGKWVKLLGTDLLPGDVVSIGRPSTQTGGEDKTVPADMLLLVGSAIVNEAILTGESTPQWKVPIVGQRSDEKLSIKRNKNHVLFGGTKILQHSPDKSFSLKTPDGGCLAVVLRTGFETSQGKLMRTILFSTERVTANSWESGLFILFLVVFAVIAAGYVLVKGLEDPTRSKYKLLLGCSLIITSVIPPELPMELSIAVNTSLLALVRRGIFCTEPFRIPFAGKVDLCCFDKTGTLTSDDMEFRGVGGLSNCEEAETDMSKVPVRTLEILASCHALVFVENKLVGDPLEKAALKGIDWSYKADEKALPRRGNGNSVQIMQRYHFASHLKRMSVIVRIQEEYLAFVKGAPETIQERLVDVPAQYIETYKRYTRQGSRVLALAYKRLPDMMVSEARDMDRDAVESDLTFAGFAVFNCPIRPDSAPVLLELKNSSHDLVMITGDQALTACHVAGQVHIVSNPVLILGRSGSGNEYKWVSPDEKEIIPYSEKEIETLAETHDLCIGGDSIEMLQATSAVLRVIPFVKVFARVAPQQKELILTTFKAVGRGTLMCGDGTNDVGALKQAHVGVALLNNKLPLSPSDSSKDDKSKSKKSKLPLEPASKTITQNGEGSSKGKIPPQNRHLTAAELQRQKLFLSRDRLIFFSLAFPRRRSAMASSPPSDPTDRDAETLSQNPSLIEKPSVVEQGSLSVENVAEKALNLESTQDEETQNLQDLEESDGRDQQLEASLEESRNEEDDMDTTQAVSSSYYRRGGGPKRKKGNQKKRKQLEKSKEKLEVLLKTLKPIAFAPCKTLDFARHEKLLKTLGLWDFVHLDFDQNIREDLVANLVAYYNSERRCSYVNGARINVSRPDLARALKLPMKKDFVVTEEERELLENDESVRFIDEIVSTCVLLQRDDMWIMPVEIVEWTRDIKQKHLEKLDWPKLLWFMVEKELKAEPPLGDCFFASHLQLLIKSQKEDLLKEKCKADDEEDDDDDDDDVKEVDFLVKSPKEDCLEVKEEDVGAADSRKDDGAVDLKEDKYVEEHMLELNLGQETVSEMVSGEERGPVEGQPMDVEENKKEEDERWAWNGDSHAGSHFLRRCNHSSAREGDEDNHIEGSMEMGEDEPIEDVEEEETEEDTEKHEGGFPFFPNGDSLQGVGQGNLMLGDASPLGYNSGLQIHGNSIGGDFLASRGEMHMAMGSGSSSLFGNGNNKREIEHENGITYHSHNPINKRLRTEEPSWDEKPPPVDMCLDQMAYWAEKARLSFAEKDREREQSVINQQYLMNELQSKTAMIQELERTKFEEQQRKDIMIYKLESELRMMTSVVEGYRKALKITQKASREHRKRCPLRDDKQVYMDVKGSGGLVLSTTEIEKLRLKQEEEDRMQRVLAKRQIDDFEHNWLNKFEEHMEAVELLNERLIENEDEVKILRETLSESKNIETSEVAAAMEETATEET